MLRPPGGTRCAGEQERQVGEIVPATIGPPFRCESQQNFDDITESDISTGRGLIAYGLRKRDVGQDGERHGKDRCIRLEGGAVVTTSGNPSSALVDGRHGGAEMDRGTLSAALGYEEVDERAISPRDSPLPTESVAHPFVAQSEGAGAVWVGRVITLDHSLDCLAQLTVLPIGKMRFQEFGDR